MRILLLICLVLETYTLAIKPVIDGFNNAAITTGKLINGGIKNVQNAIGVVDGIAHATIQTVVDVSKQRAGLLKGEATEQTASLARNSVKSIQMGQLASSSVSTLASAENQLAKTSIGSTRSSIERVSALKSFNDIFADNLRTAFKNHPIKAVGTVLEGKAADLAIYQSLNNPAIHWIPKFIKNSPRLKKFLSKISIATFDLMCKLKYSSKQMLKNLGMRMQNYFARLNPNMPPWMVHSLINSLCFAKSFPK